MARVPTTFDSFNAIAEPKRRQLLEALAGNELPVSDIVSLLKWPQPMVSKHLSVLKDVNIVSERRIGRQHIYRVNAEQLKPIHDWVAFFERYWDQRLNRLEDYLSELKERKDE